MRTKYIIKMYRITVLSLPLLSLLFFVFFFLSPIYLRLNNTLASLCWLHAGNICYSNFATISDCVYWDPVFNADSFGFEVSLHLAFCPTANEQLRDCLQVFGFLWISLWRCPSERKDLDRCVRQAFFTSWKWISIPWVPPDFIYALGDYPKRQDWGLLPRKYHSRRSRTEIKLVTFQIWKRGI